MGRTRVRGQQIRFDKVAFESAIELTISGGAITITRTAHKVAGEGGLSDELVTINGETQGDFLILFPANAGQDITLKHGTGNIVTPQATDYTIPDNGMVLLYNDGNDYRLVAGQGVSGGTTTPDALYDFPAGSWDYPASNPAPLDTDSGTNGTIKRQLFDDSTEEFVLAQMKLPPNIKTTGNVTFIATGYAVTAAANRNIQLRFGHSARAVGENWDNAYTNEDSGDKATDSTQDELDVFSWTESISNLGWASNDLVRVRLSRIAPTGNNLVGDWGLVHFRIRVPRGS